MRIIVHSENMETQQIINKLTELRKSCPMSNVYTMDVAARATEIWEENDGLLFAYEDHGISRIGFQVRDWDVLHRLLQQVRGRRYLEILTRDGDARIPGMEMEARLKRLVNSNCATALEDPKLLPYRDDAVNMTAVPADAPEINRLLWSVFKTEISHLPWEDEIVETIKHGQLAIHRSERIDAVLLTDVKPKKFYINQILNLGERKNIHAMLINRLRQYADQGGKYLYAWVEENNVASLKFHEKYGMRHDGMWTVLWSMER